MHREDTADINIMKIIITHHDNYYFLLMIIIFLIIHQSEAVRSHHCCHHCQNHHPHHIFQWLLDNGMSCLKLLLKIVDSENNPGGGFWFFFVLFNDRFPFNPVNHFLPIGGSRWLEHFVLTSRKQSGFEIELESKLSRRWYQVASLSKECTLVFLVATSILT